MMPDESALMVLVPEAEPLVKAFRDRYDPSASAGVPAHVALLHPFKHPDAVDQSVRADRVATLKEQAIMDEQADLFEPVASGITSWDKIVDLGELVAGKAAARRPTSRCSSRIPTRASASWRSPSSRTTRRAPPGAVWRSDCGSKTARGRKSDRGMPAALAEK